MNPRLTLETPAIVLRRIDYGDADRIVTFFTERYGKVKGIAKAARKSQKRFGNALEPFSLVKLFFNERRQTSLDFVVSCDVINHFPTLREDLSKTLTASYFIELTDLFTVEGKQSAAIFSLLKDFLCLLQYGASTEELMRFFEMRLLKLAGYEPELGRCLSCRRSIDEMNELRFSADRGGILCDVCCRQGLNTLPLSAGTARMLTLANNMDLDKIRRIIPSRQALTESRLMMEQFIRHILGRELKSLKVISEVNFFVRHS
ncbi:MAG: DNA repair protein RecO [Deltaproteobacteria bacterium]|nr:DNA repair protein RecO [Deltaproteobacteria bacterium]